VIHSFYLKNLIKNNPNDKNYKNLFIIIERLKHQVEFIFTIMMAILIIILFNPFYKKEIVIDYKTRILLYLFGFLIIVTADWVKFFDL
jgi:hypothetical protein